MSAGETARSMNGLILFAHGSRDAAWAAPFEAVAARLRHQRPQWRVLLAYLELMQPPPLQDGELTTKESIRTTPSSSTALIWSGVPAGHVSSTSVLTSARGYD